MKGGLPGNSSVKDATHIEGISTNSMSTDGHGHTSATAHGLNLPSKYAIESKGIFQHLRSHWKILLLGQVLSLFLASAGAAQATLHLDCKLSAPTFTMSIIYFLLATSHLARFFYQQKRERLEQRQYVQNTHSVLIVDQDRYFFCSFLPFCGTVYLKRPPWQYLIIALLDVEANAITMLAFRFTTLTSVTLFDALAIPSSMVISKIFLARRYTAVHLLGVCVCMIGVVINIFQDYQSDETSSTAETSQNKTTLSGMSVEEDDDEPYPHKIWGDLLAITGGLLYGLNDVLAEATVRRNGDTTEYLAIMGLFAFFISLLQSLILEWEDILEFFGQRVLEPGETSDAEVVFEACSISKGWWLLTIFVGVTFMSYVGASRFLMLSEAAFFNLSLLTGDLWSVGFSIVAESIVPGPLFFLALVFVLSGVIVYEMAPHPVVEDGIHNAVYSQEQQLAEIDNDFELTDEQEDIDYDEDGMELL